MTEISGRIIEAGQVYRGQERTKNRLSDSGRFQGVAVSDKRGSTMLFYTGQNILIRPSCRLIIWRTQINYFNVIDMEHEKQITISVP